MQDLYNYATYCMDFSDDEIENFLIKPLKANSNLAINIHYNPYFDDTCDLDVGKIESIYFDGEVGNFFISFYGHQTSIYVSDETESPNRKCTFNAEFMFIDDNAKKNIVSSDTFGNVVYGGTLRDKSHEEILTLLYSFVILLIGVSRLEVNETLVSQCGEQYPQSKYIVNLFNDSGLKRNIQFINIYININ